MSIESASPGCCPNCGYLFEATHEKAGSKSGDKALLCPVQIQSASANPLIVIFSIFLLFIIGVVIVICSESNYANASSGNVSVADTTTIDTTAIGGIGAKDTNNLIEPDVA